MPIIYYGEGSTYNGAVRYNADFPNGYPHGKGTMNFANGNTYIGSWTNGYKHGEGILKIVGGSEYEGAWVWNERQGYGTETFDSGGKFAGTFLNDSMHSGNYTWANGYEYTGVLENNVMTGGILPGKIPYFIPTSTFTFSKSSDANINAVLHQNGYAWNSNKTYNNGTATTITYSFAGTSDLNLFGDPYSTYGDMGIIYSFSDSQKEAARVALKEYSDIADIVFVEVEETAAEVGTIHFGYSTKTDGAGWGSTWGQAGVPDNSKAAGDVWINAAYKNDPLLQGVHHGFGSFLHEIGHALGLQHPHEGIDRLPANLDSRQYTIMSYENPVSGWFGSDYLISFTPMVYDIAAIQHIYGAASHNSGDTVYTYDPTKPLVEAIWDSGGIDTLDFSAFFKASSINLTPGSYSTIAFNSWSMTDNLGIAFGTTIEKAIGGSGNDIITGNSSDNTLYGGSGYDVISAGDGDDIIYGGTGNDTLTGGLGSDEFRFYLGDGSNTITDFDLANDSCSFFNASDQKLSF